MIIYPQTIFTGLQLEKMSADAGDNSKRSTNEIQVVAILDLEHAERTGDFRPFRILLDRVTRPNADALVRWAKYFSPVKITSKTESRQRTFNVKKDKGENAVEWDLALARKTMYNTFKAPKQDVQQDFDRIVKNTVKAIRQGQKQGHIENSAEAINAIFEAVSKELKPVLEVVEKAA